MRPAFILSILLLSILILQQGCAMKPAAGQWPLITEKVRTKIHTVGIAVSEELPRVTLDLPSKGAASGAGRKAGKWAGNWLIVTGEVVRSAGGAGEGAIFAATTVGGMLAVTPVIAGAGALYGAVEAPSAQAVESQETQVRGVLQAERLLGDFEQQVLGHITNRTDVIPTLLPRAGANQADDGEPRTGPKTDARLKIVLKSVDLRGPFDVDPPLALHLEADVALSLYGTGFYSQTFRYKTGARHLTEWTADDTTIFREAVDVSLVRLAELIVDDMFLAYSFDHEHPWRKPFSRTKR
jgi:hypothetical protein